MFEELVKGIERDYQLRGLRSTRAAKGRMVHLKKAFAGMHGSTAGGGPASACIQRSRRLAAHDAG